MSIQQLHWLRDAYKAGIRMILLPAIGEVPSKKFEIDVVYVTREQKERR